MFSATFNFTGERCPACIVGMEKGITASLVRMTFIICVFFGLVNAFINHPFYDAVAGVILGVVGIICFCAYFTPGGIPPTIGMVLSVVFIFAILILGAILSVSFGNEFISEVLDRVQYYSELYILGAINPRRLPEGWWKTDTVSFFVGTGIAITAILTMCLVGCIKSK